MGSDYLHVFTPITIKGVEFKNRIESSPMSPKLTDATGCITTEFIEFFRPRARGGASIVTIGNSAIDLSESQDETRHIDLGKDDVMLGLSKYADMCEDYGAVASIEVNHSGRDAVPEFTFKAPYGPMACYTDTELKRAKANGRKPYRVISMDFDKIQETIAKYANAAWRCKRAGFKMILLHGGHGNLIPQFLSPLTNRRTDEYGGSLENRARFALEVLTAIKKRCGDDLIIEYRNSATEFLEGGLTFEESLEFCKMIEDKIDILQVSAGMRAAESAIQYMMQPMYLPRMFNVHFAEKMKRELKVPITAVGSIMNLKNAEMILKNGWADFVALGRPLLADPDLVRKYATGKDDDVYPCIRCNYHGRVVLGKTIGCAVNPHVGRELQFPNGVDLARSSRRVMVVGGGPAGMQAAVTASQRGHEVILYEKEERLGGNLFYASASKLKSDVLEYYEYAKRRTAKSRTNIVLNTEVTADIVKSENPDVLIIAVGAAPIIPKIKGIDLPKVSWAPFAATGDYKPGKNIIVLGAGVVGYECAIDLAEAGHTVSIVEMETEPKGLLDNKGFYFSLSERAQKSGVSFIFGKKLVEVVSDGILVMDRDKLEIQSMPCDSLLLAVGLCPRKDTANALRRCIPETEVYLVGDVRTAGSIATSVNSAFAAAAEL
jgi:2,4-dienoyl-CoA reductase-like NADH-dependent reductase (Old Yellow Enzyme family)/thioredoxin reductase